MRNLYQIWPSYFDVDAIRRVLAGVDAVEAERGTIFSRDETLQSVRIARVCWIDEPWINDRLRSLAREANERDFHLDLGDHMETQVIHYAAEDAGHYGWHHDVQWGGESGLDRKLSLTIQLSDPTTYRGGDLQLEELQTTADFRAQGTAVMFPSVLRHRITPITAGRRTALVAWFFGPRWR